MLVGGTSYVEGSGVSKTVRALLDEAHASEGVDVHAARALAQQARVLARTLADGEGEAESLYRLASIAYAADQPDQAFAIALDTRDLARRAGAPVVEVWALNLVGLVHYNAGNYTEALQYALEALELYRLTDHRVDEGNLLNTVAAIHHSLGDADRALVTYEAALTANKGFDRPDNDVRTLSNMAEVRAERHENLPAVMLSEQALELAREHDPAVVPEILARLTHSYCALGGFVRARACLDEAELLLLERHGRLGVVGFSLMMAHGMLATKNDQDEQAAERYQEALEIARHNARPEFQLLAHTELASVYKRLGKFELALDHQEARFTQHETLFNRGTDLRIKTLQIAHDTEAARQQAEILRLRTGELEALVRGRTYELEEYQLEAFQRLAVLAEFRDTDTGEHTIRVGDLSASVAIEMGESPEWADQLRLAGRLHDIGKVSVPDAILLKPGPLTAAEFDVMKTHTTIGAEILSGSSSPLVQLASEVALCHHERWDGTGYPNGLHAEQIPLSGRIVSVADVYDALTSRRTYKHAWTALDAVIYIIGARGRQFEPHVVDAFVRVALRERPDLAADVEAAQHQASSTRSSTRS